MLYRRHRSSFFCQHRKSSFAKISYLYRYPRPSSLPFVVHPARTCPSVFFYFPAYTPAICVGLDSALSSISSISVSHLSDDVKGQLHRIVQKKKGGRGRCESRSEQPMMIVNVKEGRWLSVPKGRISTLLARASRIVYADRPSP